MKNKQASHGFTLVELLTVVAVIGILAAISIPAYLGTQKRAKKTEATTNIQALSLALTEYYSDTGTYSPPDVAPGNAFVALYEEDVNGNATDSIIYRGGVPYLVGFKPKSSAGRKLLLYSYQITSPSAAPCPPAVAAPALTFCITATPHNPGAPDHAPMFMDQDGTKGPDGVW